MHDVGDDVTITTTVTDVDGALVNTSSMVIAVTDPLGAAVSPAPTVTNPSVGIYRATVTADSAGEWDYVWTSTGPAGVEHGSFLVAVDPPDRLPPLATIEALEARIGELTEAQLVRAPGLLRGASAKIRAFARHQVLTRVDDDTAELRAAGHRIYLPQRPVIDVTSVALIDGDTDIALTGWAWEGLDEIDLRGALAADGQSRVSPKHNSSVYRVVYSHGYDAGHHLLEAVTDVVCNMVNRTLTAPSKVDGVTQHVVGQFSQQFQQATGSSGVGVRMYESDRRELVEAGVRRVSASIKTRVR